MESPRLFVDSRIIRAGDVPAQFRRLDRAVRRFARIYDSPAAPALIYRGGYWQLFSSRSGYFSRAMGRLGEIVAVPSYKLRILMFACSSINFARSKLRCTFADIRLVVSNMYEQFNIQHNFVLIYLVACVLIFLLYYCKK